MSLLSISILPSVNGIHVQLHPNGVDDDYFNLSKPRQNAIPRVPPRVERWGTFRTHLHLVTMYCDALVEDTLYDPGKGMSLMQLQR